MTEFTASNGGTIRVEVGGRVTITDHTRERLSAIAETISRTAYLNKAQASALREFFQHERDEELGRWRWPENKDVVVYPESDGQHWVIREDTGAARHVNGLYVTDAFGTAASDYRDAHPARNPWEGAQPGDVWVIEVEGTESFAVHVVAEFFGAVSFQTPTGRKVNMTNSTFTGFRKIWPEDAS